MLTCIRTRRRIGAYLDGALEGSQALSAARHLAECSTCQREAEQLQRVKALLHHALSPAAGLTEPDWTGFWPGVVRGIENSRRDVPTQARRRWLTPRWALGGVLAAVLLASLTLWQATQTPPPQEGPIIVDSAVTDSPGGSVMVYHTPDRSMTVVWVFGLDD